MNNKFPFLGQKSVLSGDVLFLRFIVSVPDEIEFDKPLWGFLQERRSELESEIEKATETFLGPQFKVQSITFRRGSVEILIVIGTIYYVISRYKNFMESIELFISQLKSLILHFFRRIGPQPISVYGTWSPGPALARVETMLSYESVDAMKILLWYVLLSHAALLTVFIWMIVRR